MNNHRHYSISGLASIAAIICVAVYSRSLLCGFVDYDDPDYILNNPLIRTLDGNMVLQAFREPHVGWWMPLTWISLAADYHFWGLNPAGYHLTNMFLHSINTGLVVVMTDRFLRSRVMCGHLKGVSQFWCVPLLAGLLWGLHPLRVESVAWATERKDVLNGLCVLSSLVLYLNYAERKEARKPAYLYYFASMTLFACSLMAKSVSVVLPVLLLVLDWFPLGRFKNTAVMPLLLEKVPFLSLSLVITFITVRFAGDSSYLVSNALFPWYERILVSGNAVMQYMRYTLWPSGITPYHVIPDPVPLVSYAVATGAVFCLTMILLLMAHKVVWPCAAWLLFLLPLVPVLAFIQNGDQGFAARFTYLSGIAPAVSASFLIGSALETLYKRLNGKMIALVLVLLLLAGYSVMTFRLISVWDNGATMWTRAVEYAPSSPAYWRRAIYYSSVGNSQEAVKDYSMAITLLTPVWRPYVYNLYAHRGQASFDNGDFKAAVTDLTAAIEMYPHTDYYWLRGNALRRMGKVKEAEADLARAGEGFESLGWYFESR